MLGLIVSIVATCIMVYYLIKNYQAHIVLLLTGLFLIYFALFFGLNEPDVFGKMKSTGSNWLDPVTFFTSALSSRLAGLGLIIMSVAGYAKYMEIIGASRMLAITLVKPLRLLKSPYVVLGLAYFIALILNLFIASASGLSLLLMVTIYPVLIHLGLSRPSAASLCATAGALDLGPGSGSANFAAQTGGIDITVYFVEYQIPVAIFVTIGMILGHMFWNYYMDKRAMANGTYESLLGTEVNAPQQEEQERPPSYYILLPLLPLTILLIFSPFVVSSIKMNVQTAMFICGFIAMFCEFIRHRNRVKETLKGFMEFYKAMGRQFANIVTLIVGGEVFARGLIATGSVDMLIEGVKSANIGVAGIMILLSLAITLLTVIMGSGNAAFFSFAALAPKVSTELGVSAISLLLPMQFATSIMRGVSPITGCVVVAAGLANISPFLLVQRTIVPMSIGLIITLIMSIFAV